MGVDQVANQRHHTRDDLILAVMAIGKKRIVRDVDVMRVRPRPDDLTKHGETAETGIEHQNGRWLWHDKTLFQFGYRGVVFAAIETKSVSSHGRYFGAIPGNCETLLRGESLAETINPWPFVAR